MLDELKGVGRTMFVCQSAAHGRVECVRYRDGSVGVRVEDHTVGVWEPHELPDAYRFFFTYVDDDDRLPDIIVLHLHRSVGPAPGMN